MEGQKNQPRKLSGFCQPIFLPSRSGFTDVEEFRIIRNISEIFRKNSPFPKKFRIIFLERSKMCLAGRQTRRARRTRSQSICLPEMSGVQKGRIMKDELRSESQAKIWSGRKIRRSPFFCPLIFLPSFRQAGLPRHGPESLRGDGGSHRVAVSRGDFVKGPVKVPRPISEKVKVIHNERTVKTVKWFFAILQMQPAAVQLVPTSVNRIEEKIKKCQNPCNSSKPNI